MGCSVPWLVFRQTLFLPRSLMPQKRGSTDTRRSVLDLHVTLDDRRRVGEQVYRQIRDAILGGRLRAGEVLPSTRELARRLGISRNTILLAFDRLRAEGFIESRAGGATRVRDGIQPRSQGAPPPSPLRALPLWKDVPVPGDFSALRSDFDFRPGLPDASRFPFASWRARMARQFYAGTIGTGAHIDPAGHAGLRAAIARHIGVSRAVRARVDDVIITSGSQQAVDLIARVMLAPGEVVAVEDPCYPMVRHAFASHRCRVAGVPVDADGLVVGAIPRRTRIVYVTPSHQYPLGMPMTMERRQSLLEWAQRADGAIIEDDYDSEFRYGGRPLESLQSLDGSGRVLYIGSFSKVMLPTLRLGFVVAPASLHAALRKAKAVTDWHTTVPTQAAAASFIDDGLLAQHVRRMRGVYAERHDLIREILANDFAEVLTVVPSASGLHLAAFLTGRGAARDHPIAERASTLGVSIFPLSYHYVSTRPRGGLLFGYGAISVDHVAEGLRRLRRCF